MHGRVVRASEQSSELPISESAEEEEVVPEVLAPPIQFLSPYYMGPEPVTTTSERWEKSAETLPGLTLDEAIAHLDGLDAER